MAQQIAIQRFLGSGEDIPLEGQQRYHLLRCSVNLNTLWNDVLHWKLTAVLFLFLLCVVILSEIQSRNNSIESQHKELLEWEEKNVPDTLRQKRQKLNQNHQQKVPKTGEFIEAMG